MQNKDKGMFALALAGSTVLVIGLIVAVCWNTRIIQNNADRMVVQAPESQRPSPESQTPKTTEDQPVSTVDWRDFVSRKCGFSFMYPKNGEVRERAIHMKAIDSCDVVSEGGFLIHPMYDPTPNIEVETFRHYNPKNLTPQQVKNWSAKQVAEEFLAINKGDNRIRREKKPGTPSYEDIQIEEIVLDNGKKAYGFSFSDVGVEWSGGSMGTYGYDGPSTVMFIADNKGKMYQIVFPTDNKIGKTIFSTLEFFN